MTLLDEKIREIATDLLESQGVGESYDGFLARMIAALRRVREEAIDECMKIVGYQGWSPTYADPTVAGEILAQLEEFKQAGKGEK